MYNDLISIVVPVYKVEKYLEKCLYSIINQTYKNVEIILIDDGSPDNCGKICDKYAQKDRRIKVIHKENRGVSSARNEGINISTGKYLTFIDSDDWVDENYIYSLYNQCVENDADISVCNIEDFDENTQEIIHNFEETECNLKQEDFCKELMLERYFPSVVWGKMYKKELFQEIRFNENTKIAEDLEIIFKLIKKSKKANINTHKYLYHYTIRNESVMSGKYNEDFEKEIQITQKILNEVENVYPNILDDAIQRYVRINLINVIRILKTKDIKNKEDKIQKVRKNIKPYIFKFLTKKLVRRNDKIKLILFTISPNLLEVIINKRVRRENGKEK